MAAAPRLLEQIVPEHYRLEIDVRLKTFSFVVREEIRFELAKSARTLTFHAVDLAIEQARLDGQMADKIAMDAEDQTVTLTFDREIHEGQHTLEVRFTGEIREALHGFYRSRYLVDGESRWLATTQFEPAHARNAFVCIDEPAAKAVFEVSLTAEEDLQVLSNTDPVESVAAKGRRTTRFAPTPKMSTYLVAYLVGEFESVEAQTPEGVTIRVHATPGKQAQMQFALEIGVRALSFYTEYFGVAYPLSKLDMIAVPDFAAGAMENWGVVTYRETDLLLDPAQTSLAHKQRVVDVITHELAHQWFGNLVTMAWWNDLWLNEGFAAWIEKYAADKLFPEWQVWTLFMAGECANALELDALANTHPIEVEVEDPRKLDEIFDTISYYKGASIINMLHHYLGAEVFRRGLNLYLERHSYGNTTTHDLWQALGEASGRPVDEVMSAWTGLSGHPLLSYEEGEVRQRRFYASPREAAKAKGDEVRPVPFGVQTESGELEPLLVREAAQELSETVVGSEWFKPNPGQTGFYRSLYTEGMIEALAGVMAEGTLAPEDRYGVVSDVLATTEAGLTSTTVALKLLRALRDEEHYVVWSARVSGLGNILRIVEDDNLRQELEKFGRWLAAPSVARLGWEARPGEASFDTLMRPVALQQAIRFDDEDAVAEARRRFAVYADGGAVDPELRAAVCYAAARHGGEKEYEQLLELYRHEEISQVKRGLLMALCRFQQPELVRRSLELGLSREVRAQDTFVTVAFNFMGREGRDVTWEFVQEKWPVFLKRYGHGGHMLERMPYYAGVAFATHEKAAEVKAFFAEHTHPSIVRPVAQAVESIEVKADWYGRDLEVMRGFFKG